MQPAELESAPCSGLVSSTVDTDDDSDVFVRVWSCPGELGVPVDDADALQPVSPLQCVHTRTPAIISCRNHALCV